MIWHHSFIWSPVAMTRCAHVTISAHRLGDLSRVEWISHRLQGQAEDARILLLWRGMPSSSCAHSWWKGHGRSLESFFFNKHFFLHLKLFSWIYLLMCGACMCTCTPVLRSEDSLRVSFPRGFWRSNSGHQAQAASIFNHWAILLAPFIFKLVNNMMHIFDV